MNNIDSFGHIRGTPVANFVIRPTVVTNAARKFSHAQSCAYLRGQYVVVNVVSGPHSL